MANDTCLSGLFFKLALICIYKMLGMVAGTQGSINKVLMYNFRMHD